MKLLYCRECGDIFNLSFELKSCSCGKVRGLYVDDLRAKVNGGGISLAIGNGSFGKARYKFLVGDQEKDKIWYIDNCRVENVWFRPREGPGNPHTTIDKELS